MKLKKFTSFNFTFYKTGQKLIFFYERSKTNVKQFLTQPKNYIYRIQNKQQQQQDKKQLQVLFSIFVEWIDNSSMLYNRDYNRFSRISRLDHKWWEVIRDTYFFFLFLMNETRFSRITNLQRVHARHHFVLKGQWFTHWTVSWSNNN